MKKLAYFFFFLFYAVVTGAGMGLAYLPFMLYGALIMPFSNEVFDILSLIPFLLFSFAPLALLVIPFMLLIQTKQTGAIFLATFLICFIAYSFQFDPSYIGLGGGAIFVLGFFYFLLIARVLTLLWQKIVLNKQYIWGIIVFLILLLDVAILVIDMSRTMTPVTTSLGIPLEYTSEITRPKTLLDLHVTVGEYLKKHTNINIFYLDYGGAMLILFTLINCLVTSLALGIASLFTHKKHENKA